MKLTRYTNGDKIILLDKEGRFLYEVCVYVWFNGIVSMANHKLFASTNEIPNYIESVFVTKHIEFFTSLYAAPRNWMNDNGYYLYVKPEKKKRIKKEENGDKKIMSDKPSNRRSASKTTGSRTKKS